MMQAYKPPHNIVIRDSIDEELSDDVEDDVFIRDRKSREVRTFKKKNTTRFSIAYLFLVFECVLLFVPCPR